MWAVARDADSERVPLLEDTLLALLAAAERADSLGDALEALRLLKRRGGSLPAQTALNLHEWAVAEADMEAAAWLEAELRSTGKAEFLAALSRGPAC